MMRNVNNKSVVRLAAFFLLNILSWSLYAQKLPNVQQINLRAPATVKIDGKLDEWGDQLQAHNKATNLFYSLANDDEKLYMVVQVLDPRTIEKVLYGGITLTINNAGIKKDKAKENASITFPILKDDHVHGILVSAGDKTYWSGLPLRSRRTIEVLTRTDSSVLKANAALTANAKEIKIFGIKGITDTMLSRYNEVGIKVAARFDNKGSYAYELAVPLKYLGLSLNHIEKFAYHIQLNDWGNAFFNDYRDPITLEDRDTDPDLSGIVDFWGEYILTKKH